MNFGYLIINLLSVEPFIGTFIFVDSVKKAES